MDVVPSTILCVAGILLCVNWALHLGYFSRLNEAKFTVIHEIEDMPYQPYRDEWDTIEKGVLNQNNSSLKVATTRFGLSCEPFK